MSWAPAALRRVAWARPFPALRQPALPAKPAAPTAPPGEAGAQPTLRDWVGVVAMVVGLFMAIMDVQIVTSSLTQIQGGLSASADEISWVQTAYLIADVVMVPLSGTLSRLLSTRILFVSAALGFTAASALCATATSLGEMIFYRALQGFCGGAILPSVFPVVYTRFRGPNLTRLMVLISVILNLSSTLGPTIGGFLTDTFSWHWLFLVNIVPGIAVAVVVWLCIDIDKPDLSLLRRFDVTGLLLMALFLGCLQYALEEGPRWDWLDDHTIRAAVIISSLAGTLFFFRVLTYRQPIVDLRAFTNRNFAFGSFYTFLIGTGMYSTTYLIPLFLAQVRGFSALQIGETVFVAGIAQMAMSPFSAQLAKRVDLRLMLAIGLGLFAFSMYLTAGLTNQTSFPELLVPQAVRGVSLMLCYLPANMIALGSVPQDKLKNASGLYGLTRDLGGAIALATIGTLLNNRMQFHWNRLIEEVNPARPAVQQFLAAQANRLDSMIPGDTHRAAVTMLGNLVHREALVLSYNDVLLLLGGFFVAGMMLMPLVRRPRPVLTTDRH
ncbi:MAG TPA: DHA2 family efflux MFS transporter permease subunit [Stellaceae bacterium]